MGLVEFVNDLLGWSDYYRPNFFANTPDILHRYLQQGGRPAFRGAARPRRHALSELRDLLRLRALRERHPLREGSEEYLDSEKYELKQRGLDGPLLPLVRQLNTIRREHPSLQWLDLVWLDTERRPPRVREEARRRCRGRGRQPQPVREREGVVVLPAWIGLPPAVRVRDLLRDDVFTWHIGRNYVRLGPEQSHVLAAERSEW